MLGSYYGQVFAAVQYWLQYWLQYWCKYSIQPLNTPKGANSRSGYEVQKLVQAAVQYGANTVLVQILLLVQVQYLSLEVLKFGDSRFDLST